MSTKKKVTHPCAATVAEKLGIEFEDLGIVDGKHLGYCDQKDHVRLLEGILEYVSRGNLIDDQAPYNRVERLTRGRTISIQPKI